MPVPHLNSYEEGSQLAQYNSNADLEQGRHGPQPPALTYQKSRQEQDIGYPMDNRYAFESRDTIDSREQLLQTTKKMPLWQKALLCAIAFGVLVGIAFGISKAVNAI